MGRGRVAIAGGGVAGLAAAVALLADGFDVTVHERAPRPPQTGPALGLDPAAVLALRRLAPGRATTAGGVELRAWELLSWRGERIGERIGGRPPPEGAAACGALGITVPRARLQRALHAALPPGTVRYGSTATGCRETAGAVELLLADGTRDRADLLIAADGTHSAVRRQTHGDAPPRRAGYTAWWAVSDTTPAELPEHTARQVLGHGATFGCLPLADGRIHWVATLGDRRRRTAGHGSRTASGAEDHARLMRAFQSAPAPTAELIAATPPHRVIRTPVVDRPPAPGWSTGRTLLIGDAAHPMVPATGQGAGQGAGQALLDAVVLADVLRGAELSDHYRLPGRLRTFEERRFPVTAAAAQAAWHAGRLHHEQDPEHITLRGRRLRATTEAAWLSRLGLGTAPDATPGACDGPIHTLLHREAGQ